MLHTTFPPLHARTTVVARSSAAVSCSVVGASWLVMIISKLAEWMLTLVLLRFGELRLCRQCSAAPTVSRRQFFYFRVLITMMKWKRRKESVSCGSARKRNKIYSEMSIKLVKKYEAGRSLSCFAREFGRLAASTVNSILTFRNLASHI